MKILLVIKSSKNFITIITLIIAVTPPANVEICCFEDSIDAHLDHKTQGNII
jgi:hypothetical protein